MYVVCMYMFWALWASLSTNCSCPLISLCSCLIEPLAFYLFIFPVSPWFHYLEGDFLRTDKSQYLWSTPKGGARADVVRRDLRKQNKTKKKPYRQKKNAQFSVSKMHVPSHTDPMEQHTHLCQLTVLACKTGWLPESCILGMIPGTCWLPHIPGSCWGRAASWNGCSECPNVVRTEQIVVLLLGDPPWPSWIC